MTRAGDRHLETAIGRMLRIGVMASSTLLAAGLVLSFFDATAGTWLMRAGIVILIGTPAARVVLSFVDFAIGRNVLFMALTAIVIAELAAGVIAALVFHRRL